MPIKTEEIAQLVEDFMNARLKKKDAEAALGRIGVNSRNIEDNNELSIYLKNIIEHVDSRRSLKKWLFALALDALEVAEKWILQILGAEQGIWEKIQQLEAKIEKKDNQINDLESIIQKQKNKNQNKRQLRSIIAWLVMIIFSLVCYFYKANIEKPVCKANIEKQVYKRFIRSPSGVISDKSTDLKWFLGLDKDTTWFEADTWVKKLNIDGGNWRLPSVEELLEICGDSQYNINPIFELTNHKHFWSNKFAGHFYAWCVHLYDKKAYYRGQDRFKNMRVFAVRSSNTETKPTPSQNNRFKRYKTGVIADNDTGLEWYLGPNRDINWEETDEWVKTLDIDRKGWRLPSYEELNGIHEDSRYGINSIFKVNDFYFFWTKESCKNKENYIWCVHLFEVENNHEVRKFEVHKNNFKNGRAFAVRLAKRE